MKCFNNRFLKRLFGFIVLLIMGNGIQQNEIHNPCQFSMESWSKPQPGFTDQLTHKLLKSPDKVLDTLTCLETKAPQDACLALGRALAPHRSMTSVRDRLLKLTGHSEKKRAQAAWFGLLGDRDHATRTRLIDALHNENDKNILSAVLLDLAEIKESLTLEELRLARIETGKILSQFNLFASDKLTGSGILMDAMEIYLTGPWPTPSEFSIIKNLMLSSQVGEAVLLNGMRLLLASKNDKKETRELLAQMKKTGRDRSLLLNFSYPHSRFF